MKLGIGTYAYMWAIGFNGAKPTKPMTAMQLLTRARELGVGVVQYGPNLSLAQLDRTAFAEVIAKARGWNIELEMATRGLEAEHLRRQIKTAKEAGVTVIRTIPELEGRVPTLNELHQCLVTILPELAKAGIRLAIENGKIPAAELRDLLNSLSTPHVGITLDTVNSLAIPEGWREVATTLARYVACLHIKDFEIKRVWHMMGFSVEGKPAGQGQLDLPWLLDTVRGASVTANAILELWPPEQATLEATIELENRWAEQSIPYLRRYIPE